MMAQKDRTEWNEYLYRAHFDLVNQITLIPHLAVMWGSARKQHLLVQSVPLAINESESSVLFHDFHVGKSSKVTLFLPRKTLKSLMEHLWRESCCCQRSSLLQSQRSSG